MTVRGVDVSSYQPTTYSTKGLDFVFVKATEGTSYINPRMTKQAQRARAAGLVVGFYHFLRPGSMREQARYFVEKCASVEGDPLWADWEDPGVSGADKDAFLSEVKQLRGDTHRVGLYCNVDYWTRRDTTSNAGDALWIAQYNGKPGKPSVQATWKFHQYTSTPIDTNVGAFADRAALAKWAGAKVDDKPAERPTVDLSNLTAAARKDPGAKQGHQTHAADVRTVEAALKAEGLLASKYASDGSFGTVTVAGYAAWQRRCGYSGAAADGIPGRASLDPLAQKHGFAVTA
ncbi:GH25 family lysozyme [Streptomyces iconiensis]|uniref:GH25 family lysozyme n=1 Tax=Streptomyces iconiensis TaxID=1384038 RepID=A0ABT7A4H3_9ACTN|nr:GH25 family lysozyme [Streptomyces iconiensis]MDJ1136206.1 GH25 family lysozyme [Streptomyces iconiensis]